MRGRPTIELLFFSGCPHYEAFLPHLRRLLHDSGIESPIKLVEITDAEDAERQRFLGSPTLRVGGVDVDPSAADRLGYGMQCRLYLTDRGTLGAPPDDWVLAAVQAAPQ